MLALAFALLLCAAACAVVLADRGHRAGTVVVGDRSSAAQWRGAALDAHADAKELRHAILAALDARDDHRREAILNDALRSTRGPVAVRVTL